MYKVLHIMPHMGPGVGKAVSAVSCCAKKMNDNFEHEILLIEKPCNSTYIDVCKAEGIKVDYTTNNEIIMKKIYDADIVQLEWWHHPLMLGWIHKLSEMKIRLTVWSHISGCSYPIIPAEFVKLPDQFFFTTKYSFENPFWKESDRKYISETSTVAYGTGGFDNVTGIKTIAHDGFNIGYTGTLDFCKLNQEFVDYCSQVDVPDHHFIMVGNAKNRLDIENLAREKGIAEKFEFTGFTQDIKGELARFDVFGYILNPKHFGATDNALLEAMAAGLPIIVLNQCGEKHVIQHNETGLIVNNPKEYGEGVRYLYKNPSERKRLGDNARKAAYTEFSVENTVKKLHKQYKEVLKTEKKQYDFTHIFGEKPYQWFLSGLGEERSLFESSIDLNDVKELEEKIYNLSEILKGNTKSSIPHFYSYYQNDEKLKKWVDMIKKE